MAVEIDNEIEGPIIEKWTNSNIKEMEIRFVNNNSINIILIIGKNDNKSNNNERSVNAGKAA